MTRTRHFRYTSLTQSRHCLSTLTTHLRDPRVRVDLNPLTQPTRNPNPFRVTSPQSRSALSLLLSPTTTSPPPHPHRAATTTTLIPLTSLAPSLSFPSRTPFHPKPPHRHPTPPPNRRRDRLPAPPRHHHRILSDSIFYTYTNQVPPNADSVPSF